MKITLLNSLQRKKKRNSFTKNLLFTLILGLFTCYMQAAIITSTAAGGPWATGSTWIGGAVPGTGDAVIIATTGTGSVNIAATITQTVTGSVTVNNGASLTMLTVGKMTFGALTVNSSGMITTKRNMIILGATNVTGRINFGSTVKTGRNYTFNGAVTLNAGAIWDETNGGTNSIANKYTIKGNFTNNATNFTALATSIHNLTGSGSLTGNTPIVWPKATFTGTYTNNGILTCNTSLTVNTVTLTNNGTITAAALLQGSGGIMQGSTGVLNIGKTSTITTFNATATGNIVTYTGAVQTIKTGNYSTLNLSGSGIKTFTSGTSAVNSLSLSGTVSATTVANLAIANNLTVGNGATFTTGANYTQSVIGTTSITGTLILGGTGAKTFTGDVILNEGSTWNESGVSTINFGGNFTNNADDFTTNTGGHNFTGSNKILSGTTEIIIPTTIFTGTYTNNATVTTTSLSGTGTFIQGANGVLNIGGVLGISTLNAATAGNTVNYNGAAQTGFVTTYSNLTVSGSGTKTFGTSPTVNGTLSLEDTALVNVTSGDITYGTTATLQYNTAIPRTATSEEWITPFLAKGGILIKNTGAITTPGVIQIGNNTNVPLNINAGGTLTPGANLITFHGDYINNGTITSGSGGITIGGTTASQSIDDFTTTGNVTFTKTSGTTTMIGNMNGGALTINGAGGTLNLGVGMTHTFTGIVTLTAGVLNGGSSTLNANATSATAWNGTGSVFNPATGTVNFGAAGDQIIGINSSFYNLEFSGSGTKTLTTDTTINGDFAVSDAAVADLGPGLSHSALSITLGDVPQVSGTWGSTASSATNKNATWFGSTATGIININCSAPTRPTSVGDKVICSGEPIPTLTVTASSGQVDWYNQAIGGTLLQSNSTSFTPTAAGTYYAGTILSGCVSATRAAVVLTINPKPTIVTLTGSSICASPGGNGKISSTTSQAGVNYQLFNASNTTVQAAKLGTGSALTWLTLAAGNGYYVVETNTTTGCISTSSTVNIISNPTPLALVITGSTICANPGDDGTITSTTSQVGIDYQLYDSSNAGIASITGTGSALTWTDLDAGTGYYVTGANALTGCTSTKSNTVAISTLANPIALVLTGNTICASPGGNGTITSTTSQSGVEYQVSDSNGDEIGPAVLGTGAALSFTGIPAGSDYYVDGINLTTGCESLSSNLVKITANANPTNKTITLSSATICTGTGAIIIVAGSLTTESYQLRNNTGNTLIGSAVVGNAGSLNLPSGNLTTTTTFNVLVTNIATGCTTVITTTPTITVNAINTAGTPSSSPTLCMSTALSPSITITTTGATAIGTATGLPSGVTAAWASNKITISGTPTASGTFNYSIPLNGGCGTVNAIGTIIVNPLPAGTLSNAGAVCSGTQPQLTFTATAVTGPFTLVINGQTYTGKTSGVAFTATGTAPIATTTYTLSSIAGASCSNSSTASTTVTVNTTPTVGATSANQTVCNGSTLNSNISIASATGTIQWQSADNAGFTIGLANIGTNATTLTIAQVGTLTTTKYFRAVVSGVCASVNSATVMVSLNATTNWTGAANTNWNNAANWTCGLPHADSDVTINAGTNQPFIASDVSIKSLTIGSSATLTLTTDFDLTVANAIANSGTLNVQNNANLIQIDNVANTGSGITNVYRKSSDLYRLDYTMWSSPVTGSQSLLDFSPLTSVTPSSRFYTYNTATDQYNSITNPANATFNTGEGILIRMPNNWPAYSAIVDGTPYAGQFKGTPNNGTYTHAMSIAKNGYNAVGNPYPSALNVANFIDANIVIGNENIDGTLWFWRKTNDASNLTSYSTITKAGIVYGNSNLSLYPDHFVISSGQGFIVKAKTNTLNFNNAMRSASNVNQFFKTAVDNKYWLELTNSNMESYGQNLIAYIPKATLDYDNGYDGLFINDSKTAIMTLAGNKEVVIQARPEFDNQDVLPIIFKTDLAGTYTINLSNSEGIFNSGQNIYLKDNNTGKTQILNKGSYTFTTAVGNFTNRFEISYQSTLSVANPVFNENQVVVYKKDQNLTINSGFVIMDNVQVFDVRGRLLFHKKEVNATEITINTGGTNEILLVKITSQNSEVVTKKVRN